MFIHLGADIVVPLTDVIAIHDIRDVKSVINADFLQNMKAEKRIVDVSENNIKSFVITDKYVYLSAISSLTLKKRAGNISCHEE